LTWRSAPIATLAPSCVGRCWRSHVRWSQPTPHERVGRTDSSRDLQRASHRRRVRARLHRLQLHRSRHVTRIPSCRPQRSRTRIDPEPNPTRSSCLPPRFAPLDDAPPHDLPIAQGAGPAAPPNNVYVNALCNQLAIRRPTLDARPRKRLLLMRSVGCGWRPNLQEAKLALLEFM